MTDDRVVRPPDWVNIMEVDGWIFIERGYRPFNPQDAIRLGLAIIDMAVRVDPSLIEHNDMEFLARYHRCALPDQAIAEIVTLAREAFGEGPQEIP